MTSRQCKAARALLGWTQKQLAREAIVGTSTVADFERKDRTPIPNNLRAIQRAFEREGLIFVNGGVTYAVP